MSDEMDMPQQIDGNDVRYVPAIKNLLLVRTGFAIATEMIAKEGFEEALQVYRDCAELARQALLIVEEMGDIESALKAAEVLNAINTKIAELEEIM